MTALQSLTLLSAIFGAIGSLLTVLGSWGLEPAGAFGFAPENWKELEAARKRRNQLRLFAQRAGLSLIVVAFILQGMSAFVSSNPAAHF